MNQQNAVPWGSPVTVSCGTACLQRQVFKYWFLMFSLLLQNQDRESKTNTFPSLNLCLLPHLYFTSTNNLLAWLQYLPCRVQRFNGKSCLDLTWFLNDFLITLPDDTTCGALKWYNFSHSNDKFEGFIAIQKKTRDRFWSFGKLCLT